MSSQHIIKTSEASFELHRTVRFALSGDTQLRQSPKDNTYAAWPPMRGLGRYMECDVTCVGQPHSSTGIFINITQIDHAVREVVLPILWELTQGPAAQSAEVPMAALMQTCLSELSTQLPGVTRVALRLAPTLTLSAELNPQQGKHMDILWRQQFTFSASHRLHCHDLSDAENEAMFGKCNRIHGHGHNYKLEIAVTAAPNAYGQVVDVHIIDAWVNQNAVERLDHRHLNLDIDIFKTLNPTIENIAQVIWQWLEQSSPKNVTLSEVTVWETEKTSCTYRG